MVQESRKLKRPHPAALLIELQQAATQEIEKARDYFQAGEHYFSEKQYRDAATSYQASLNVIPTFSAYLNLSLSLRYLSDYQIGGTHRAKRTAAGQRQTAT